MARGGKFLEGKTESRWRYDGLPLDRAPSARSALTAREHVWTRRNVMKMRVKRTRALAALLALSAVLWGGAAFASGLSDLVFFSTQFAPVEEQAKFREILKDGGFDYTADSNDGPMIDLVIAETKADKGTLGLIGALHGSFPPLQQANALANLVDLAEDLGESREFAPAYLQTGLLGSEDTLYYIPWMQATYIMAANKKALDYLPEGVDLNTITYSQLADWSKALYEAKGGPLLGLPHAGLFQRFLQGYLWPSFTGGMVSKFQSVDAIAMLEWVKSDLWPYVHPESINYNLMHEPLLKEEVWVAFDHTARLLPAFSEKPDEFVAFPAPAGPAGLGYMPVIVGLAISKAAPDPEAAKQAIEYLTRPGVQARVLNELGFFPAVGGVDTSHLPKGIAMQMEAVNTQASAPNAIAALLPVGLGARGGEINQIFRNAFDRTVLNGEDVGKVLEEEAANLQLLMDETGAPAWPPDPASDGPSKVLSR